MPMNPAINPSGFYLEGGPVGLLLIHGFTGSPPEMRRIGDYLNERGLTVSAPLLPGHGTSPDDLNNYRWRDFVSATDKAFEELREKRKTIFVAGLSVGALLTLQLAARHGDITGIITYAAAIEVKDWRRYLPKFLTSFIRQLNKFDDYWAEAEAESLLWSYDTWPTVAAFDMLKAIPDIKGVLPQITCPLLAIYSLADQTVSGEGVRLIFDQVSSSDKQLVELKESGHVLTIDKEWEKAAEMTYQFIAERVPEK